MRGFALRSFFVLATVLSILLGTRMPSFAADAPPGSLRVDAIDEQTKKTAAFATVEIYGPIALRGVTNLDGSVTFTGLPAGEYNIVVTTRRFSRTVRRAVVVGAGPATVAIGLKRVPPAPSASRLRQIGSTKAQAKSDPSTTDTVTFDSPTTRLSGSILGGLASSPDLQFTPAGGVSIFGKPENQTTVNVDGVQVSGLGDRPNVASYGLDLFASGGVSTGSIANSGGGSLGFQTRNPSLDWIGSGNGILGSFGGTAYTYSESGTVGLVGVSYAHAFHQQANVIDGLGFRDTSGLNYVHDGIARSTGDALKIRFPLSTTNVVVAQALSLRDDAPIVCNLFTASIPCGYGPNNRRDDSLFSAQLRDTFSAGRLDGFLTGFRNHTTIDVDRNGLFVGGVNTPQRSFENRVNTGIVAQANVLLGEKRRVTADFSTNAQTDATIGTAFGTFVPPALANLTQTRAQLSTDLINVRHFSTTVNAGLQAQAGQTHATQGLNASYRPVTSETYSLQANLGAAPAPPGSFAGISDPLSLTIDCAGANLQGFGPSRTSANASTVSVGAGWQHTGPRVSPSFSLRHETQYDVQLSELVNANALAPSLFAPGYLANVRAQYANACGAGAAAPDLGSIFYAVGEPVGRTTYDTGDVGIAVFASRNVRFNFRYTLSRAVAYGNTGLLFGPGSTVQSGKQLPSVPLQQADFSGAAVLGRSDARVLAHAHVTGANNANHLPAFATFDTGVEFGLRHGPKFNVSLLNVTNAYGRQFATVQNAIPYATSFGPFQTVAQPLAPRTIQISARIPFGPGAQLDDVPQYDLPTGAVAIMAQNFPEKQPTDPFTINRRSPFCGPETLDSAKRSLAAVRSYTRKIEEARGAGGAYPTAFADALIDGMRMIYHRNGESYALLIGTDKEFTIAQRNAILRPLYGCINAYSADLQESQRRGLYLPTFDESEEIRIPVLFSPATGFYFAPPRIDNGFDFSPPKPVPSAAPSDPFALQPEKKCGPTIRPAAEAFAAALRSYVTAVDAGAAAPQLPEGIVATPHRETGGTWYDLSASDLQFATITSCFTSVQVKDTQLTALGLGSNDAFGPFFATRLGFYLKIFEMKKKDAPSARP